MLRLTFNHFSAIDRHVTGHYFDCAQNFQILSSQRRDHLDFFVGVELKNLGYVNWIGFRAYKFGRMFHKHVIQQLNIAVDFRTVDQLFDGNCVDSTAYFAYFGTFAITRNASAFVDQMIAMEAGWAANYTEAVFFDQHVCWKNALFSSMKFQLFYIKNTKRLTRTCRKAKFLVVVSLLSFWDWSTNHCSRVVVTVASTTCDTTSVFFVMFTGLTFR